MDMLMSEIENLHKLDHHNIVNYLETYNDNKYVYLVMKFVEGTPLQKKIDEAKQNNELIDKDKVKKYMKQILQAINHCHAVDLVHRDIKPDNIMIDKDDNVTLIDFGLTQSNTH